MKARIIVTILLSILAFLIMAVAVYHNADVFGFCVLEDLSVANVSCVEYFNPTVK